LIEAAPPAVPPTKPPKNDGPKNDGPKPPSTPSTGDTDFVISSFNILGSSHTAPGGINAHYASGVERTRWAADLLKKNKVDVVGFQEMNPDQAREFKKIAGKEYGLFPGDIKRHLGSHNSIAWDKSKWDLVSSEIHEFPSHMGRQQPTPLVRLRDKQTGQEVYILNVHNAPGYHKGGTQQKWRDLAVNKQVALINELKQKTGLPVIVTGDLNDKEIAFKRMTQEAGLKAANAPNGRMPKRMSLDWIFGSKGVDFSGFTRLTKGVIGRITDHGVLVSKVRID
jgi:endonuclease/exonuclease/phosphatase family metal-dependent hydrolase